jgi:hypothetical protein
MKGSVSQGSWYDDVISHRNQDPLAGEDGARCGRCAISLHHKHLVAVQSRGSAGSAVSGRRCLGGPECATARRVERSCRRGCAHDAIQAVAMATLALALFPPARSALSRKLPRRYSGVEYEKPLCLSQSQFGTLSRPANSATMAFALRGHGFPFLVYTVL